MFTTFLVSLGRFHRPKMLTSTALFQIQLLNVLITWYTKGDEWRNGRGSKRPVYKHQAL